MPYFIPPVSRAANDVMDRVVAEHLALIQAELHTNHGTSLKDTVLRIEEAQSDARRRQEALSIARTRASRTSPATSRSATRLTLPEKSSGAGSVTPRPRAR